MGLIGCPRTDQPDSRYASAMRLVVGRIYVTMLVLLYPLFGSSHMQLSLCLSMQKKKNLRLCYGDAAKIFASQKPSSRDT